MFQYFLRTIIRYFQFNFYFSDILVIYSTNSVLIVYLEYVYIILYTRKLI